MRAALALFERLGAQPWRARATDELAAAGAVQRRAQRPRRAHRPGGAGGRAVARGTTNREVAEELFLSPKTI